MSLHLIANHNHVSPWGLAIWDAYELYYMGFWNAVTPYHSSYPPFYMGKPMRSPLGVSGNGIYLQMAILSGNTVVISNLTSMNYSTWGIHYFQTNPFIYVYLWMSVIFPYTIYDINAWEIATKKLRTTLASPKNIENICAHDKMAQIDHQLANLGLHCLETVSLGERNLQGNKRRTQAKKLGLQKRKGLPIISLLGNVWKLPLWGSPNFETYQGDIMWALGIQKGSSLLRMFPCSLCLRENAEHHLFQPFSLRAWSTVKNQSAWHRTLDQQWGDMAGSKKWEPYDQHRSAMLDLFRDLQRALAGLIPWLSPKNFQRIERDSICVNVLETTETSSLVSMVFDSIVCAEMIFKKPLTIAFSLVVIHNSLLPFWKAKFKHPPWIPLSPKARHRLYLWAQE